MAQPQRTFQHSLFFPTLEDGVSAESFVEMQLGALDDLGLIDTDLIEHQGKVTSYEVRFQTERKLHRDGEDFLLQVTKPKMSKLNEEVMSSESRDDPFAHLDLLKELDPANWTEVDRLHTPTLDAVLIEGRLILKFQNGSVKQFSRREVEDLTRFLIQYAKVEPLVAPEDPFEGWTPERVTEPEEQE